VSARPRSWRALGVALLALVTTIAAGAGLAALVLSPARPGALTTAPPIEDVPVTSQTFDDRRSVTVRFTLGVGTAITSPGDGRITSFPCAPGGTAASGESLLALDGRPALTLATRVPLWRDLVMDDRGDDVSALQRELARLGEPVTVDGVVGRETLDALERRFRSIDDDDDLEAVEASRVLWIPAPTVTIDECTVGTGSPAVSGEPLATLTAGLSSAAVEQLPDDLVGGERTLLVDGQSLPLGADGAVTDVAALAMLAASPRVREAVGADATSVTADLELVEAVEIAVVPPSSVVAVDGRNGCIVSDGRASRVEIVGSRLGQSLVRVASGASNPSTVDSSPPEDTACG
jgi:peptidoglycan hydrolase-like protein with peptidoglycan-binding domain